MTFVCIFFTIAQIGEQIQNYENKDTVWQTSEIYPPDEILTPLIIFCSEPHIFESDRDIVYNAENAKTPNGKKQIKKLKTSLKVLY